MTISYRILDFPTFPISKQVFVASGQAIEGGMTVGGVRMLSPEPGGRSMLEIQPSLQVGEWTHPLSSWLMSKVNGDIFRVRLAPTPQVARSVVNVGVPFAADGNARETPWSNQQNWSGDALASFVADALPGSNVVKVNMTALGTILRPGHVIGHGDNCYLVDEISYDNGTIATIVVNPPLRRAVIAGDVALLRPFFLGTIANGEEIRTTYDAESVGYIQLPLIRLSEVIL